MNFIIKCFECVKSWFKSLFFVLLIFALSSCSSCKHSDSNEQVGVFEVEYRVTITGEVQGDVDVIFPKGYYKASGASNMELFLFNGVIDELSSVSASDVVNSGNLDHIRALEFCNGCVRADFDAHTSAGGTYDLWVKGFVTEKLTGLTFAIEKHLTNKVTLVEKKGQYECIK